MLLNIFHVILQEILFVNKYVRLLCPSRIICVSPFFTHKQLNWLSSLLKKVYLFMFLILFASGRWVGWLSLISNYYLEQEEYLANSYRTLDWGSSPNSFMHNWLIYSICSFVLIPISSSISLITLSLNIHFLFPLSGFDPFKCIITESWSAVISWALSPNWFLLELLYFHVGWY